MKEEGRKQASKKARSKQASKLKTLKLGTAQIPSAKVNSNFPTLKQQKLYRSENERATARCIYGEESEKHHQLNRGSSQATHMPGMNH